MISLFEQVAEDTLELIDRCIAKDNGKRFKQCEKKWFSSGIEDAWKSDKSALRDHLGASQIGEECERKAWLNFRVGKQKIDPRLIRLWNRGHLEEARFLALLEQADIRVWNLEKDGRQFGYSKGIFAGSIDGLAYGLPEYPNEVVMLEFKTMSEKNFNNFVKSGLNDFEIYERQCYVNMYGMNNFRKSVVKDLLPDLDIPETIERTLFMAVNKNNDAIHARFIPKKDNIAENVLSRIDSLCNNKELPEKLSEIPSFWKCKICDYHEFCFGDMELPHNCRTCAMQEYDCEKCEMRCVLDGQYSEDCYLQIDFEQR